HNKNEIEIVADKFLRWLTPLEVFLIQSTVSYSRTKEENATIKLIDNREQWCH
nr:hypothetical protein [Tanacetum cinerariifolium]